jgi:hypothetical protein
MLYRIEGAIDPAEHGQPIRLAKIHKNEIVTALSTATALLSGAQ